VARVQRSGDARDHRRPDRAAPTTSTSHPPVYDRYAAVVTGYAHSSRPCSPSCAANSRVAPNALRLRGVESFGPGSMSAASPVPSTVPSDFHSSYPWARSDDSKNSVVPNGEQRSPVRPDVHPDVDPAEPHRALLRPVGPPDPFVFPGEEVRHRLVDNRHLLGPSACPARDKVGDDLGAFHSGESSPTPGQARARCRPRSPRRRRGSTTRARARR
jgi:hypothetical protein